MARFSGNVTLVQPHPQLRLLYGIPAAIVFSLGCGVVAGLLGGAVTSEGMSFAISLSMLVALSAAAVATAVRFDVGATRTAARIEADRDGIHVDGALRLARADVVDGYLLTQRDGTVLVRLLGKRRVPKLSIAVASHEAGEELLRALELDVLHRVLDVATLVNVDGANWPTRILVGADGVLVKLAPLGFIPYADIERVEATATGGAIVRRSGGVVRWAALGITAAAIRERVEEGLAAHRTAAAHADPLALVARSGRSARAWLDALRGLVNDRDYRDGAVPDEALWKIAEDPTAEPTSRAGAAVILKARGGDGARVRIEAAAKATAQPRMRVALEAVAEDDEHLERALENCEEARG